MNIEIDQSNKIEKTDKDTAIAFSNDKEYAILLLGKTKRQLQELFRERGRPRIFVYRTFAAGVTLLIKDHLPKFYKIIIDQEYTGKERVLRSMIYEMLGRFHNELPEIVFERIGKSSNAHNVAYHVTHKKREADRIIKFNEIKELVFP